MTRAGLAEEKSAARKRAAAIRDTAHSALAACAGQMLADLGLGFAAPATPGVISGFFPYMSEIDTRPLLTTMVAQGWRTALPVVEGAGVPLSFRSWVPGEPTVPGAWNIPIPPRSASQVVPDVMLVPLLAFDRQGFRLGYGGGFYDRTISLARQQRKIIAIGVAYAEQEIEAVPHDGHDEPLDWVLTEQGCIKTRPEG